MASWVHLLATSYTNIWPFWWNDISVVYEPWAHLIKAPIWSWKSFLFFDGPLYALYKSQSRPLLAKWYTSGSVCAIVRVEESIYAVQRVLKSTKAWNDSAQSNLYEYKWEPQTLLSDTQWWLHRGVNIVKDALQQFRRIETTNQREVEDLLWAVLPPKEVYLNVYSMMQDSSHVFTLPPAQRVTIFKHLFGLLWIDESKQRIYDERKRVQGMLQTLPESDGITVQERNALHAIATSVDAISKIAYIRSIEWWNSLRACIHLVTDSDLLNHIESVDETLLSTQDKECITQAVSMLQDHYTQLIKQQGAHEQTLQRAQQLQQTIKDIDTKISSHTKILTTAKARLDWYDTAQASQLEEQYAKLVETIRSHTEGLDYSVFPQQIWEHTVENWYLYIQRSIDKGKQVAQQIEQIKREVDSIQNAIRRGEEQIKRLIDQDSTLAKSTQNDSFHCDKIQADCPYIELIKGSANDTIKNQRALIKTQIKTAQNQISEDNQKLIILNADKRIGELEAQKQELWVFLTRVWRKKREEVRTTLQQLERDRNALDTKRTAAQTLAKELTNLQNSVTIETESIARLQQERTWVVEQVATIQLQLEEWTSLHNKISSVQQAMSQLVSIQDSRELLERSIEQQKLQRQQRFEREASLKRLKDLYAVFSKELLITVLQDFLPQLQEVMNTYLAQVVEYEVRFSTQTDPGDMIELDISIHDTLWERPVKSLSGWQRAVLKICRIMSVASLMNSTMLFMDETINNLDESTVADVWALLEDFVRTREMSLYVVTHAPQIQWMDIWESILEIQNPNTEN